MTTFLLAMLAVGPGALLMYLILWMDRNEREPLGLVLKVMVLGALGFVPAVLVENALGWVPSSGWGNIPAALWDSFVKIAPIEELVKMAPVFLLAWSHPQFNEENDGIVYAASSALGFATVENLFYVLSRGFAVGVARAVTSLPLHGFTGVVMGYYIGKARFAPAGGNKLVALGFLWAYLAHAVYDFQVLSKTPLALLLLPMVAVLVVIGMSVLRRGRAMSLVRTSASSAQPGGLLPETGTASKPVKHIWKAALGRTLLVLCLLFWVLLALGMLQQKEPEAVLKTLVGGVLLSFAPLLAGVLLEISYRNRRRMSVGG